MSRRWHPSLGDRRDEIDEILRGQALAHQVLAEDAAGRAGLTNVRPLRHLHVVYDWQLDDEEAE